MPQRAFEIVTMKRKHVNILNLHVDFPYEGDRWRGASPSLSMFEEQIAKPTSFVDLIEGCCWNTAK